MWDEHLPRCVFVGLNPSKADGKQDDPTIRRCIGFTQSFLFGGFHMLNLYAYRTTYPQELLKAKNPNGPLNVMPFLSMARQCDVFIAAWGPPKPGFRKKLHWDETVSGVIRLINKPKIYCLGTTQDGSPRHPLFVRGDTKLEVYDYESY